MAYLGNTIIGGSLRVINGLYSNTLTVSDTTTLNGNILPEGKFTKPIIIQSTVGGSYNEGIRINKASNSWAGLVIGSNANSTAGAPSVSGGWFVAQNTSNQFLINNVDSNTSNAALWINTNKAVTIGTLLATTLNGVTIGSSPKFTDTTYSAGTTALLVAGTDTANRVWPAKQLTDYIRPRSVEYIVGTQTAATGSWTGVTTDAELYDGKTIMYYLPFNGSGNATLNLTLSGGGTTGAKNIRVTNTSQLTTHYGAGSVISLTWNAASSEWRRADYWDGNTYDRVIYNVAVKAAAAITADSVVVGTSAGYKSAASGVTFDISYPILWADNAIASGSTRTDLYLDFPNINLQSTKASWTGTAYAAVYLVGTLSGNTFTIDSSVITTTVPTSADSKVYIPIGVMHNSTTNCRFCPRPSLYQYTNGSFHLLDRVPSVTNITRSGTTFTATKSDGSTFTFTQQDNNTTYSANNGVGLSGTTFYNSGVRSIATGSANGTISVNTNGTAADVAVKGLGSAAYTASTAYATSGHTHNYAGSSSAGGAATSAAKLNTNAGSATQPVYFSNGVPVATTYALNATVPSGAKFTDTVYTHPTTSGNKHIPSGGSSGQILRWSADGTAAWGADNNTTYAAGNSMTLSSTTFNVGKRWNAITQGQKWSRIMLVTPAVTTEGTAGILSISCTRGSVVCNATFYITSSHAGSGYTYITQLSGNNYTAFKIRGVSSNNGVYYFEIYDTANSIASGTAQTWHCTYIPILDATVTMYTAFTDGSSIPSGYSAVCEQTTVLGSNAHAIRNITRSGTTFTATRQDGTTFTFTQQDNNTTYSANNGVGLSGTTFYNSGVRSIATGSSNGTISVNTNGTAANVAVKGLGTAAYTASTAYAAASHTHSYAGSSSAGGAANTLANGGRLTTCNTSYTDGLVRHFLASSSMTTGKPPADATVLQMSWDGGKWDGQIAVGTSSNKLYYRSQNNTDTWAAWKTALAVDEVTTGSANGTISVAGANVVVKGLGTAAYTASTAYATSAHSHGLTNNDFTTTLTNTTEDSGWSMINSTYSGFLLKSIRFNSSAPAWGIGNYGSGICFGGSDTKGIISLNYNSPGIKIAGGNGTKPVWYIGLTGTNTKSYNLDSNITNITRSGTTFTATKADGSTFTFTQQDNNTTYSANNGVSLSGTTFSNSGVRSIATGSSNGTISVNTNGTAADVAVKGLGSAAYTASTAYATSSHTHNYAGSSSAGGAANSLLNFTSGLNGVAEHNANNIKSNGVWYYTSNGPAKAMGATVNDGALYSQAYSTIWAGQIAQDYRNGNLFIRGLNNGSWTAWEPVLTDNYRRITGNTTIYVSNAATGDGTGSSTSNYMSIAELRRYLTRAHTLHASTMTDTPTLTILFAPLANNASYGDMYLDSSKMPGIRYLVINTSTGTNTTTSNYTTNAPHFASIVVKGSGLQVTMRNIQADNDVCALFGGRLILDTYIGCRRIYAQTSGYVNLNNGIYNIHYANLTAPFLANEFGILYLSADTVNINFREQCIYTGEIFDCENQGRIYIRYDLMKFTGTKPIVIHGGSGTVTATSETAANTAAKVATLASGQSFTLTTGATAKIRFTVANTASNPTLNINNTGAKPLYYKGAAVTPRLLIPSFTYDVKYNGTQFEIQNGGNRVELAYSFGFLYYNGNYNTTYKSGSWNWDGWARTWGSSAYVNGTIYGGLSGNASTATTATKLGTATVGGVLQPIYLNAGTATALRGCIWGNASGYSYSGDGTASTCSWGTLKSANSYTNSLVISTSTGGGVCFADKSGQTSMQIDGIFYQNEGTKRVLDTGSITTGGTNGTIKVEGTEVAVKGLASGAYAAAYSHPTGAGNNHIPAGGSSGQILRWSSAGVAAWGADNNTTYSNFVKSGSTAAAGLVPAPPTTAGTTKYLREDCTWQVPPDNNTTYSAGTTAILNTGTDTANRVWPAKQIADYVLGKVPKSIGSNQKFVYTNSSGVVTAANFEIWVTND